MRQFDSQVSSTNSFSRRDFLKIGGTACLSVLLPKFKPPLPIPLNQLGRVIPVSLPVYDEPSLNGKIVKDLGKDSLLIINEVTLGDEEPAHNRVWYKIEDSGYVHSGKVQPVRTQLNSPVEQIPSGGALAEVTVPFTDAYKQPSKAASVKYRFYYETTHWVTRQVLGTENDSWYEIYEDKFEKLYYVQSRYLRIIPAQELAPISPAVPMDAKRIEVRIRDQVVIAYEAEKPVFMSKVATGAVFKNGNYSTPFGSYRTSHKRPTRHMASGNLAYNGFDLPGIPWICYFTKNGISFHGTYWHNDYGRPRSHGCVNMSPQAAKWIYLWTVPIVPSNQIDVFEKFGTKVDVIP
jgi:lipoprotein-anchoring transpeptidase ErfK/SrfK